MWSFHTTPLDNSWAINSAVQLNITDVQWQIKMCFMACHTVYYSILVWNLPIEHLLNMQYYKLN